MYIILLIVAFLFLNYRYKHSYYYLNLMEFENRPLKGIVWSDRIRMVNLGSVHARFAFEYNDNEGISLARSPQSLFYDLQLLKYYEKKIPKNCLIIGYFPICLFALDNYKFGTQNAKYYYELPKNMIEKYSSFKNIIYNYFPVVLSGKHIVYAIINKKVPSEIEFENCIIKDNNYYKAAIDHQKVWMKQFGLANTSDADIEHLKEIFDKNKGILLEIIALCKKNEWKFVVTSGPVAKELNQLFSESFLEKFFYKNFITILKDNNIKYLDYRRDEVFQENHDYFWNGVDYLSKSGRRKYMNRLTKDLKNIGLL